MGQTNTGSELTDIEVDEISFVDKPANGIPFCIVKMYRPGEMSDPAPIAMPKVGELGIEKLAEAMTSFVTQIVAMNSKAA